MARKLIVMFDGTWNNKKSETNVIRMREAIASSGPDDREQPCFYDPGVGTHWYDRITGGAFGRGLSENIQQGYRWLAQKYQAKDEIYVFGFSRGAYTARSLVGLIRKCGILNSADESSVARANRAKCASGSSACGTPWARSAFPPRTCPSAATSTGGTTPT